MIWVKACIPRVSGLWAVMAEVELPVPVCSRIYKQSRPDLESGIQARLTLGYWGAGLCSFVGTVRLREGGCLS